MPPTARLLLLSAVAAASIACPVGPAGAEAPDGVWPLVPQPAVVTRFDPPATPFGPGHRGVDLAGRPGEWVRSSLPGRVVFAGVVAGRGVVVVDHGATRTTYEPVGALVAPATPVRAGQVIGVLEVSGSHCFPAACLHWGWIRGTTYLDPLLLVDSPGPVRLWPWDAPDPVPGTPDTEVAGGTWASPLTRWAQALGCACW